MDGEQWVSITDKEFISYAGTDATRWQTLVGSRIVHPRYGEGTIVTVKGRGDRNTVIEITFGNGAEGKLFGLAVIGICNEIQVPFHRATHLKRPGKPIHPATTEMKRPQPRFRQGQQVVLAADPKQRGVITSVPLWASSTWQYEVFFSAQRLRFHRESDLAEPITYIQWIGLEELLRNLALVKLRQPMSDGLYAIYGSRTQFEVYQFKPALKFLGNPDQRLLIADEVGLGKTIEAGIIYLELQARLDLKRVLIVCPSKLRQKWQSELQFRFDEEFTILDAAGMRRFIQQYHQYGVHTRLRGIISLELIRREEFAEAIVNLRLAFDLLVIDEAHYCRNTGTLSNNIANIFSENADAMLLLTATPLQTGNEDLFNLLHILSPGEFDNYEAFLERLEPNQFVNRAARMLAAGEANKARHELRKVEQTLARQRFINNPYYGQILKTLVRPSLSREQQMSAQRRLVDLNTLANIFTRTRKREIAEKAPLRQASTLMVTFSPAEATFYQLIIEHVREEFARLRGSNFVAGWVTIMYERQAASSIAAARERFAEIAREVNWSTEEADLLDTAVVGEVGDDELKEIQERKRQWYQQMAAMRFKGFIDSKFNVFWQTLQQVLKETPQSKVLVFSFFRDTITYLQRQMRKLSIGTEVLHGGIPVADRAAIIDRFRDNESIRILISSEVGAEGLDFQFCDTLFNYDLPWNPMRVEQRIGRIDRFGQQAAKIRIFNLVIDNTIESRILIRLYERIGLFEQAVGDIEAILGEEIRELSRRVYTSRLSPAEEERLAEQAANNIVRRQQDMEEFEKRQLEFMGQEAIFSTLVNETITSGHYVSDLEVYGLVQTFIREVFPRTHLERNEPYDGTYTLEVGHDLAQSLSEYIPQQMKRDQTTNEFLRDLVYGKELPLTFTSNLATSRKRLKFITPRHPLTQAAVNYWNSRLNLSASLAYVVVDSDEVTCGDYYFFLFALEASGAERTSRLVPVAISAATGEEDAKLSELLLHLIQTRAQAGNGRRPQLAHDELAIAEERAKVIMSLRRDQMEEEIMRSNEALINGRLAGVDQSYEAKKRRVQQTLDKVTDPSIIRLHVGRLRNLQASYEIKRKEIESMSAVSVGFSLMLRGFVRVVGQGDT